MKKINYVNYWINYHYLKITGMKARTSLKTKSSLDK